jgi:hypothetical protein
MDERERYIENTKTKPVLLYDCLLLCDEERSDFTLL